MFGIIGKLRSLLSDENVRYLDVLLSAMTHEGSPVYGTLWTWFEGKFPESPGARVTAWRALVRLRKIVQEYRSNRGI
jgi:hypothetical protein